MDIHQHPVLISFAVVCETSRFSSAADAEFRGTEGLTEQPIRHNVHKHAMYMIGMEVEDF